jgi:hypothetical protein
MIFFNWNIVYLITAITSRKLIINIFLF